MDQEHIYTLIKKYRDNSASEAEKAELLNWYRQKAYQDADFPGDEEAVGEFMRLRLQKQIKPTRKIMPVIRWVAAASVLLIAGVSWLLIFHSQRASVNNSASIQKDDIAPGGNKAILTLANGSKISLTDAGNGKIAKQNGIQITKAANGQLVYTINKVADPAVEGPAVPAFNIIETPKGGQYQVVLPDGSKVWLNALSSLKFPVNFSLLKERRVELTGEAYFEVVHDQSVPFRVVTEREVVEDIGTHFDVNAYNDEGSTKTTLLQGLVRVTAGGKSAQLTPGQQARLAKGIEVTEVNTEEVIAWKKGYFNFDDEKLGNIMKSVSRWYDVNVDFQDEGIKNETFGAVTTRFANISTLLRMMEQTGDVKFSIDGNTIKISRKK
ncbi:DUF4974 domain-containing protein [Mucilaginibacter sp. BJC16-A38]|uniref:FecR family protein n=1 Tax=Mucilaginibacter phenanthrenivorans TaxID=1234842 RepID=UPI0021589BE8|nr:FecR family protein [Mucilaginibacter phenanthrenivorans]MCR8560644.1 DUF4974 domain-containing protein [Mucilaginibacter phenanthrenivorans]